MTKKPPLRSPAPARPTPKSAETRARIIAGALATLETHRIDEVTTRRIAASANVRLATLHYHFESKEALLLAALDVLIDEMGDVYRAEIGADGDPAQRLEQLIRSIWRYVERTRNRQIAQLELTLFALRTKGSEWLAARQYQAYIAFYRRLIEDSGLLPDSEAEEAGLLLSRFILGGIDGLILQSFALNDAAAARAGLETLITAAQDCLAGIAGRPGQAPPAGCWG